MSFKLEKGQNNVILRQKAGMVDFKNHPCDLQKLTTEMFLTLEENNGVGLAAPQIGKSYQIAVILAANQDLIIINPEITFLGEFREMEEGCLSLPGEVYLVKRAKKIHLKYFDLDGKKQKIKAKGLLAEVIQHEVDHLNGILICDKTREK